MKNLSLVRFKSEDRETPFAPNWDYRLIEGEIDDVDFNYIARYLLNKKNEILKAKGQLIIEHRSNISFINKSPGVEERNYGSNSLSFFKKASL